MNEKDRIQVVFDGVRAYCAANADEALVKKYSRFFTEGYDAYGLSKEAYMAFVPELAKGVEEELSLEQALRLGDLLFGTGKYEEGSYAIRVVMPFQREFSPDTFQRVGDWFEKGVRNWAHCDVLCGELLSIFLKTGICGLEQLSAWRDSSSKWKRRAVPVAMIELLRNNPDMEELLRFIDPMMMDQERFVHQGLGWFLREAWKRQPEVVEPFLMKWKDSAPRKIFQYATEKMTKEQRTRFRAERKQKR